MIMFASMLGDEVYIGEIHEAIMCTYACNSSLSSNSILSNYILRIVSKSVNQQASKQASKHDTENGDGAIHATHTRLTVISLQVQNCKWWIHMQPLMHNPSSIQTFSTACRKPPCQ
jgi:hypothetical protein